MAKTWGHPWNSGLLWGCQLRKEFTEVSWFLLVAHRHSTMCCATPHPLVLTTQSTVKSLPWSESWQIEITVTTVYCRGYHLFLATQMASIIRHWRQFLFKMPSCILVTILVLHPLYTYCSLSYWWILVWWCWLLWLFKIWWWFSPMPIELLGGCTHHWLSLWVGNSMPIAQTRHRVCKLLVVVVRLMDRLWGMLVFWWNLCYVITCR